jgi:hypothetical protein
MPKVAVTLIMPDGSKASTQVGTNRHGQLPSVIVDPRDSCGRVLDGTWLGESRDRETDGTTYEQVQLAPSRFAAAGRASGRSPARF